MNDTHPEEKHTEHEHQQRHYHRDGSFGGIFLIFLGVVFILINTGILPGSIWRYLFQFWPLVLILMGIDMLLRGSFFGRIVAGAVTLTVALYLILSALYIYRPNTYTQLRQKIQWLPRELPVQRPQRDLLLPNVYVTPNGEKVFQN